MRPPEQMVQLFRRQGLKVTPQRVCIFEILWAAQQPDAGTHQSHPSAEAVFAEARMQMPTMSLRTVYQTLNDLAGMGEIHALDVGTGSTRFDPNSDAHHHLVCNQCGTVRDLYADYSLLTVPAGSAQGFEVGAAEVVFRGLCEACQAAPPQ